MNSSEIANKIIIALDFPTFREACLLMDKLDSAARIFKVGSQLFTSVGPDIIREVKHRGKRLFLDLKFHDIPNTVARASEAVAELGVDIFNIHVSGGLEMMRSSVEAVRSKVLESGISKPVMLGVTMLTSIDSASFRRDFSSSRDIQSQVVYMAKLAQIAGMDGVVASPQEIRLIRDACGSDFVILTPGIRPWKSDDDQKRTMTPSEAIKAGADYLVIGRPISQSPDPCGVFTQIIRDIETELHNQ